MEVALTVAVPETTTRLLPRKRLKHEAGLLRAEAELSVGQASRCSSLRRFWCVGSGAGDRCRISELRVDPFLRLVFRDEALSEGLQLIISLQ